MKKKLFVSNLDFEVTSDYLREIFEAVGVTLSVVVALDRETKRSRGFAFVEMESDEDATKALELNGKLINGRAIKVVEDRGKSNTPAGAPQSFSGGGSAEGFSGAPSQQRKFELLPPIQRMYLFKRKRKVDPYLADEKLEVDYRDVARINYYVSDRSKILSRRMTGLAAKSQRAVSKAIKRAQNIALIPLQY